jgi:hypothetical protein
MVKLSLWIFTHCKNYLLGGLKIFYDAMTFFYFLMQLLKSKYAKVKI